jgi:hypothetical protein
VSRRGVGLVSAALCAGFLLGGCTGAPGGATVRAAASPVGSASVSEAAVSVPSAAQGRASSATAAPRTSVAAVKKAPKTKALKPAAHKSRVPARTKTKARSRSTAGHRGLPSIAIVLQRAADSVG